MLDSFLMEMWALSQFLPKKEFEKIKKQRIKVHLNQLKEDMKYFQKFNTLLRTKIINLK